MDDVVPIPDGEIQHIHYRLGGGHAYRIFRHLPTGIAVERASHGDVPVVQIHREMREELARRVHAAREARDP